MKKENTSTRLKQLMETRNLKQVDILKACEPFSRERGRRPRRRPDL